jgi:hypothetical protein
LILIQSCSKKHLIRISNATGNSRRTKNLALNIFQLKRSTILSNGARVACWPLNGGIWIKHACPVELDFLSLSRSNDVERPPEKVYEYITTCPPSEDRGVKPQLPLTEEDLFCQKLRMIGADFWEPPRTSPGSICVPIENLVMPKYRNHLGFFWDVLSLSEPYVANLTKARRIHGPGLKGLDTVRNFYDCLPIVKELGGIWCGTNFESCSSMWCSQYPEHCHETDRLHEFDLVYNEWVQYGRRGAIFDCIK